MQRLLPTEHELIGGEETIEGEVVDDSVSRRIEGLVATVLRRIGSSADGWNTLYLDPEDGRFWEYSYPQSHMHGGGPPALKCLSNEEVRSRYGWVE
jgi:hypothetical protein